MNILETYVFESTKSVALMDYFEGDNEEEVIYDQMLVKNNQYLWLEGKGSVVYQLVIERREPGQKIAGDITFTNFKKGNVSSLLKHIQNEIDVKKIRKYVGKDDIYRFETAFKLRAQNSSNRTGYGWEWDWSGGYGTYIEGTQYGETTDYVFAGIKVLSLR